MSDRYDRLISTEPVPGKPGLRFVAWHQGGAVTLRIGKRHIARETDLLGRNRVTLCGRRWKASAAVNADAYWTTGDCARCATHAEKVQL